MTKEELQQLYDSIKNHPYQRAIFIIGEGKGLNKLSEFCDIIRNFQEELFRLYEVRKNDEWRKNPQLVLIDACSHDMNHTFWYLKNGWCKVCSNAIISIHKYIDNLFKLFDETLLEKPVGYTLSTDYTLVKRTVVKNEDGAYRSVICQLENERDNLIKIYQKQVDRYNKMIEERPDLKCESIYYAKMELEQLQSGSKITNNYLFE